MSMSMNSEEFTDEDPGCNGLLEVAWYDNWHEEKRISGNTIARLTSFEDTTRQGGCDEISIDLDEAGLRRLHDTIDKILETGQ